MTTTEFLASLKDLLAPPHEHPAYIGLRRLLASWPDDALPEDAVAGVIALLTDAEELRHRAGVPIDLDAEEVRRSPADARLLARAEAAEQLLRCSAEIGKRYDERLIPRHHDRVMARYPGMEHGILGKTRVQVTVAPAESDYEIDEIVELRDGGSFVFYELEFDVEFCRLDLISPTGRCTDYEKFYVPMTIEMFWRDDEFRYTYRLPEKKMQERLEDYWERELQHYDSEVE